MFEALITQGASSIETHCWMQVAYGDDYGGMSIAHCWSKNVTMNQKELIKKENVW